MLGSTLSPSQNSVKEHKEGGKWLSASFKVENFLPGIIIGFIVGMLFDISKHPCKSLKKLGKSPKNQGLGSNAEELKMVLVVRQDLKMGSGKIASQCAHAATGMYAELMQSQRYLLRQWELCGQPKIVVTCKNQQEMNKLKDMAESIGLPTFVVADAGHTQVLSGSKTVLAIGPGRKALVDEVTGKQHLL